MGNEITQEIMRTIFNLSDTVPSTQLQNKYREQKLQYFEKKKMSRYMIMNHGSCIKILNV